jgi:hypothetical protein
MPQTGRGPRAAAQAPAAVASRLKPVHAQGSRAPASSHAMAAGWEGLANWEAGWARACPATGQLPPSWGPVSRGNLSCPKPGWFHNLARSLEHLARAQPSAHQPSGQTAHVACPRCMLQQCGGVLPAEGAAHSLATVAGPWLGDAAQTAVPVLEVCLAAQPGPTVPSQPEGHSEHQGHCGGTPSSAPATAVKCLGHSREAAVL